jgi:hypothetical protein
VVQVTLTKEMLENPTSGGCGSVSCRLAARPSICWPLLLLLLRTADWVVSTLLLLFTSLWTFLPRLLRGDRCSADNS